MLRLEREDKKDHRISSRVLFVSNKGTRKNAKGLGKYKYLYYTVQVILSVKLNS